MKQLGDNFVTIPISVIVIENRYRKEFGDIDTLAEDINKTGLIVSITVKKDPITGNYFLVDGQRRILAVQRLGWTEIDCYVIDPEEIVVGEYSANTFRKDFVPSEAVRIKKAIEPYQRQKSKEREFAGIRPSGKIPQGKTRDIVAKQVGFGERTLKKAEEIVHAADQDPKYQIYVDEMDSGKPIHKIHKKYKKDQKKEELKSIKTNIELPPENYRLYCNDFTKIDSEIIPDNSIDLLFTDPPYGSDSLHLYKELGITADRVLKDGGSLVFYAGHIILNQIFRILDDNSSNLKYWWILSVKHNGAKQRVHSRSVFAEWKPLIWYTKGQKPNIIDTMFDHIESSPPDKSLHEWAQSPIEAEHIIRYLTVENQTILDPMFGSGITGIAALKLNRKFIGIEIDQERFNIGKNRIASTISTSTPLIKNNTISLRSLTEPKEGTQVGLVLSPPKQKVQYPLFHDLGQNRREGTV
jgi:DNA modification methylase/ParB-like chromosome segregation protein Spo0J